jgi:hypothetical protein
MLKGDGPAESDVEVEKERRRKAAFSCATGMMR